jgi:hypothetical protein
VAAAGSMLQDVKILQVATQPTERVSAAAFAPATKSDDWATVGARRMGAAVAHGACGLPTRFRVASLGPQSPDARARARTRHGVITA